MMRNLYVSAKARLIWAWANSFLWAFRRLRPEVKCMIIERLHEEVNGEDALLHLGGNYGNILRTLAVHYKEGDKGPLSTLLRMVGLPQETVFVARRWGEGATRIDILIPRPEAQKETEPAPN